MRKGIDCKGVKWEERKLSKKAADPRGLKFGKLTPVLPVKAKGKAHWLCECDCGNFIVVRFSNLNAGTARSCGCLLKDTYKKEHLKLIGQRFGRLLVIEYEGERLMPDNITVRHMYKCLCDCGSFVSVAKACLTTGHTQSCGCLQKDIVSEWYTELREDIVGMRFGKLTVIRFAGVINGYTMYECLCDCGESALCHRGNLLQGNSQSCGCIKSLGELHIGEILLSNKIEHKKEYTFPDLLSDKGYHLRYDFGVLFNGILERLIEFDGPQHNDGGKFFGKNEFERLQTYDALKNQYALSHNIPLVRIPYSKRDNMTLEDLLGDKYLIKGDN